VACSRVNFTFTLTLTLHYYFTLWTLLSVYGYCVKGVYTQAYTIAFINFTVLQTESKTRIVIKTKKFSTKYPKSQIKNKPILFFGPCIFNDDERINQQNAQINFSINLLLFNQSNIFRPPSRSHHQGVQKTLRVTKPLW